MNDHPFEKVPLAYQQFEFLSDTLQTNKHYLEGFKLGRFKLTQIVHFNSLDSTLVIMGSNYGAPAQSLPNPVVNIYYKLDAQGTIVDSLEFSEQAIPITRDGYIIGNEYHCSWMLDGDETRKPYQLINGSLNWDMNNAEDKLSFETLYRTATRVLYQEYHIERKAHASIKLLNNGMWTKLQIPGHFDQAFRFKKFTEKPILDYEKYPTSKPSEVDGFEHSHLQNLAEAGNIYTQENKHISLAHYRKVKFIESKSNGALNPNSMTYPAKWEGEGYMELNFKKNTIPFKITLDKIERDGSYERKFGHPLRFYTNEYLEFGVISENYGDLFLIKENH